MTDRSTAVFHCGLHEEEGEEMFGKKKTVIAQVREFRCGVCGLDCVDQHSLERHAGWSHAVAETPALEKAEGRTAAAKPA